MSRVAGSWKSGNMPSSAASSVQLPSSSTLSPLAPPFTVDRSLPGLTNPSALPPPPPACAAPSKSAYPRQNPTGATVPYFVPSGDAAWPPSSSAATAASSRLGTLNSVFGVVEAAPYYPYYASMHDSVDGSLGKLLDYKGYAGGWTGQLDVEKGIPSGGCVGNSSWLDPSPGSQMSLPSHRRGGDENFGVHGESFGSWHGVHNGPPSVIGHVGSEHSEWLDERHLGIYEESNRALSDGSELDRTMWPSDGLSYFYSPETTSVVKECDTFIPNSYDRYISQLISSSRDPIVHYPASTSSRQGNAPSNERNGSSFSCTVSKHRNSVVKHVNLQRKDDDRAVSKKHDVSIYKNAEGKEGLDKMGISGDAIWKGSGASCSSLLVKGLSSCNSSPLGQSIGCLQDVTSGFKVANLYCKVSNSGIGSYMPDNCIETPSEMHDHLNVAVDSPCWKGSSVSRENPFGSDEILEQLVIGVNSGSNALVQGRRSSKIQPDIEQAGTTVCHENGKDTPSTILKDLSPLTDLSDLDLKLRDCTGIGRVSNPAKVENAKETAQQHIHGEYNVLIEQAHVPESTNNHVRQLCQAEDIICEGSSNTEVPLPAVQHLELDANHLSNSQNCPFKSKICASSEMSMASPHAIFPNELKEQVSSNASSKCFSQGQDIRALVKAMLSLSEVLLCHYCHENGSFEEDLKPVRKIIDNLEAVILRNKKDIIGGYSSVPMVEEAQLVLKESNADLSCNKDLKDTKENRNLIRWVLNNQRHDNIITKTFNTNFEESDGIAQSFTKVPKHDFMEQEEDPKMLLYKKLWMQTEAALSSLKHDVALIKLEMGSFKHPFKGSAKSQTLPEGPAAPTSNRSNEHQGSNPATSISISIPSNIEIERNLNQTILKEDEDASVLARYRILKGRREADFADVSSYADAAIEKGVLQSHNANKTTVASANNVSTEKFLGVDCRMGNGLFLNDIEPGVVQESLLSGSDGSVIQPANPRNHVKWLFSSGSDSQSSEWEHVPKDDFLW